MLVRALVASAALIGTAAAPAAAAGEIETAVAALARNPVFVHPDAEPSLTDAEAARLTSEIARSGGGPVYVAVLPDSARAAAGGDSSEVLRRIAEGLRRPGTYAAVVGGEFRAGSNTLSRGVAADLATEAFRAEGERGLAATLVDFVDRVGAERSGDGARGGGGGEGGGVGFGGLFLLLMLGAGGFLLLMNRRRRRRVEREEMDEVRGAAREDLVALGEDIRALDLDIEMPGVDPAAREDYARALDSYERAGQALDRARTPEQLAPVAELLEDGRFAMTAAKARLDGRPPPERRPPCFFDPRHGPSDRDVEWAPPGGVPRLVPACEADAQRVDAGFDPQSREITVGGQTMPYWSGPAAYQPFAGGFFGGFGGGLFPGLLIGSMLGSAFDADHVHADPGSGFGDFGGGGDFGDFGGGGGFGGGDFGGGGDF